MQYVMVVAGILLFSFAALGQGPSDEERTALFWTSHQMAQERSQLPRRHIALYTTTLGTENGDGPANFGGKLSAALADSVWVSLEVLYLGEAGIDGFASVQLFPGNRRTFPLYVGAGAGLGKTVDYQLLAGFEFSGHFYIEAKYVGTGGDLPKGSPSVAAGFILPF